MSLEQQREHRNLLELDGHDRCLRETTRKHRLILIMMIRAYFPSHWFVESLNLGLFLPFHQSYHLVRFCHMVEFLSQFLRMDVMPDRAYGPDALLRLFFVDQEGLLAELRGGLDEVV